MLHSGVKREVTAELAPGSPRLAALTPSKAPVGPLTRIFVQLGLRRFPLGPRRLRSLLSSPELLLEALVKVPEFTGSDHRRVALRRSGKIDGE